MRFEIFFVQYAENFARYFICVIFNQQNQNINHYYVNVIVKINNIAAVKTAKLVNLYNNVPNICYIKKISKNYCFFAKNIVQLSK